MPGSSFRNESLPVRVPREIVRATVRERPTGRGHSRLVGVANRGSCLMPFAVRPCDAAPGGGTVGGEGSNGGCKSLWRWRGLYLLVHGPEARFWLFRYIRASTVREMDLGPASSRRRSPWRMRA
jgi:hypothetical protein